MPEDRIELRFNDNSAPKLMGTGSFGSRSLISHGGALMNGAKEIVEKGKALAAGELEVSPNDVTFENGVYKVAGTDLSINIRTLIEKKWDQPTHPLDTNVTLDTAAAFPSGAHIAEVEIDPDTGACADRELHRRRRLRQRHQPRHRRGATPRRADAGHRPGAGRAHRLRPGHRAAPVRHVHGLLHAARASPHADHADRLRRAVAGQSARRQGRGRGGRDRLGARARQRGDGRAQGGKREAPRNAVHAGAGVAARFKRGREFTRPCAPAVPARAPAVPRTRADRRGARRPAPAPRRTAGARRLPSAPSRRRRAWRAMRSTRGAG